MNQQEVELMEEQRRFDDLMEFYRQVEIMRAGKRAEPSFWPQYSAEQIDDLELETFSALFTRIPTTFLLHLQDTVNDSGILLQNQNFTL